MFRRQFTFAAGASLLAAPSLALTDKVLKFGLTPVFLTNDRELLQRLEQYLATALGGKIELVFRKTYQEITSLLIAGELQAAWICGYPYLRNEDRLTILSVPVWQRQPLYQAYMIARADRTIDDLEALEGDVHAYSDPDSNSGYLVTQSELIKRGHKPASFFEKTFYTFGHRNVVRSVAAGLSHSGSVDGYVWQAMNVAEPELTMRTQIVWKSEWMGFPPIACLTSKKESEAVLAVKSALLSMNETDDGRTILGLLQLDRFMVPSPNLFEPIRSRMALLDAEN
ncbi:MAG: PhnD/SsuA/transferrin family substrate-binding protein [Boseongicola sp.]|nr:MAG: PhnD/SsuA/transferrin family substrate-binding protein [Boseongicola sp.]